LDFYRRAPKWTLRTISESKIRSISVLITLKLTSYRTPFQQSVESDCDYSIISQLLSYNADLYHQDITGRTPLHVYFNSAVQSLIEFHYTDIDSNSQDSRGMTVPQYVAWTNQSSREDLLRCCNGDIACLGIANEEGKTQLHFACQRGNVDLVNCLLASDNLDISVRDYQGRTSLQYAIESSRSAQVIELLLKKGADLDVRDIHGRTVMHYAASLGNLSAVQKLIDAGTASQVFALDDASKTPFELAISEGKHAIVEYLQDNYNVHSEVASSMSSTAGIRQVRKDEVRRDLSSGLWVLLSLLIATILFTRVSTVGGMGIKVIVTSPI
jgi:ankyrin repeat protein